MTHSKNTGVQAVAEHMAREGQGPIACATKFLICESACEQAFPDAGDERYFECENVCFDNTVTCEYFEKGETGE